MSEEIGFCNLPYEIILKILMYCDVQSLGRLGRTCKGLNSLIQHETSLWKQKSKYVLGTNMLHPAMQKRCMPRLTPKMRCKVSKSWFQCRGHKKIAFRYPYSCMPWLQLESDNVYCSTRKSLVILKRNTSGNISYNYRKTHSFHHDDISKFIVSDKEIVIAFTDGALSGYTKQGFKYLFSVEPHSQEIFGLHVENDMIITGSRDCYLKVFQRHGSGIQEKISKDMGTRVLSTAIMPSSRHFMAGFSGTNNMHPLQVFDMESEQHITNCGKTFQHGAGILDIYPENPSTFLSCGYDTTVKLWDIRCPQYCCSEWMDPYDNAIYCVTSDHNVSVVSGANRHGIVHIWDKRVATMSQFMCQISHRDSPVYSVAFDATHIFASLSRGLMQYTFY